MDIRVKTDTTTAVVYVNRQGGTHSQGCHKAMREIRKWCDSRSIHLLAVHIPGVANCQADHESRNFSENTEWILNQGIFRFICDTWGTLEIDLFASRNNYQLPRYASWGPDPGAEFIDAFSENWGRFNLVYAFPPFRLLCRTVQKATTEGARTVIVTGRASPGILSCNPWPELPYAFLKDIQHLGLTREATELFLRVVETTNAQAIFCLH